MENPLKQTTKGRKPLLVSILASCSSYRESIRRSKERQGPTLGVRFGEVSVS